MEYLWNEFGCLLLVALELETYTGIGLDGLRAGTADNNTTTWLYLRGLSEIQITTFIVSFLRKKLKLSFLYKFHRDLNSYFKKICCLNF